MWCDDCGKKVCPLCALEDSHKDHKVSGKIQCDYTVEPISVKISQRYDVIRARSFTFCVIYVIMILLLWWVYSLHVQNTSVFSGGLEGRSWLLTGRKYRLMYISEKISYSIINMIWHPRSCFATAVYWIVGLKNAWQNLIQVQTRYGKTVISDGIKCIGTLSSPPFYAYIFCLNQVAPLTVFKKYKEVRLRMEKATEVLTSKMEEIGGNILTVKEVMTKLESKADRLKKKVCAG